MNPTIAESLAQRTRRRTAREDEADKIDYIRDIHCLVAAGVTGGNRLWRRALEEYVANQKDGIRNVDQSAAIRITAYGKAIHRFGPYQS